MFSGCPVDAQWMPSGFSVDAQWMLNGCSVDAQLPAQLPASSSQLPAPMSQESLKMSDVSSKVPGPNFQRREAGKSEFGICCKLQGARDQLSAPGSGKQRIEGSEVAKSEVGIQKLEVGRLKSDI